MPSSPTSRLPPLRSRSSMLQPFLGNICDDWPRSSIPTRPRYCQRPPSRTVIRAAFLSSSGIAPFTRMSTRASGFAATAGAGAQSAPAPSVAATISERRVRSGVVAATRVPSAAVVGRGRSDVRVVAVAGVVAPAGAVVAAGLVAVALVVVFLGDELGAAVVLAQIDRVHGLGRALVERSYITDAEATKGNDDGERDNCHTCGHACSPPGSIAVPSSELAVSDL